MLCKNIQQKAKAKLLHINLKEKTLEHKKKDIIVILKLKRSRTIQMDKQSDVSRSSKAK